MSFPPSSTFPPLPTDAVSSFVLSVRISSMAPFCTVDCCKKSVVIVPIQVLISIVVGGGEGAIVVPFVVFPDVLVVSATGYVADNTFHVAVNPVVNPVVIVVVVVVIGVVVGVGKTDVPVLVVIVVVVIDPFPVVVIIVVGEAAPIVLSTARFASFCFKRQRAVRSRDLALRRLVMVVAALLSLILLSAARFASFCLARQRAVRLRDLALRRSMMVALASIVGCCYEVVMGCCVVGDEVIKRRVLPIY
jgi:hypothetical protein